MNSEKHWSQRTEREKLIYIAARVAFFIPVIVFILSSNVLVLWMTKPAADAIAVLLALLPFYWVAPERKMGLATYVGGSFILAAAVLTSEYFFIR